MSAADVALYGLHVIIPLMSSEVLKVSPRLLSSRSILHNLSLVRMVLLCYTSKVLELMDYLFQFPVLCSEFFKLTTYVCEMYPAKMSLLPQDLFKNLMTSLEVGLTKYPLQCVEIQNSWSTFR